LLGSNQSKQGPTSKPHLEASNNNIGDTKILILETKSDKCFWDRDETSASGMMTRPVHLRKRLRPEHLG